MNARSVLAGFALLAAACGGGSSGGGGGSPTGPTGGGGQQAATITINSSGVSQQQVRIEVGQQVQFANSATRNVEIQSDPHEVHNLCPPLNAVGTLTPGQSKTTGTFTVRGTCTYHDHTNADDGRFRGSILVGVNEPGPAPDYRTSQ
jgi:plastocyanin